MNRRYFMAGVTALAGRLAAAGKVATAADGVETVLRSGVLDVVFDAGRGLPTRYRFDGETIEGDGTTRPLRAIACRLAPRRYVTLDVRPTAPRRAAGALVFPCVLEDAGTRVAAFDLRYAIEGAALVVTIDNVVEQPGHELIEIAMPRLVTMHQGAPAAWFAEGREGGSFVRLADAKAHVVPDDQFFGRISSQMPVGMVGTAKIGCVMEVSAFMDGTETAITTAAGSLLATLGTIQVHRVHGGRCYDMNAEGPPVCGNARTPNLLVGQTPRTRLDFFVCRSDAHPWVTGAKILRERAPRRPSDYHADKLTYMIQGKLKTEPQPRTTFAQSETLIREVAMLTDYAPQLNFISGWVYDGQDTGYPSEDKLNVSLGTYQELRGLIARGPSLNANVSVNVNYDDAYKSSPIFDPAFIARRPDGAIWKSRAWAGEMSYIVGMAKFVRGGWAARRLHYTKTRYGISGAMLIDALSFFTIRNDWDLAHPASGYVNLVDGKYQVLDLGRSLGLDICSEQFRYPMLGKMARSVNGPLFSDCPFGGDPVPLMAIAYRHSAIWGNSGDGSVQPGPDLFFNSRPATWYQADTDRMKIAEFYFLVLLPLNKIQNLPVEDYGSSGGMRRLVLADGASISLGRDPGRYVATWRGAAIAEDGATFCPIDADRIAFYATKGRTLRHPLPAGWDAGAATARALTLNGRRPFAVDVKTGEIVVTVPARQPVIVYRNSEIADRAWAPLAS